MTKLETLLLLLLAISIVIHKIAGEGKDFCQTKRSSIHESRPHSVSISEFGAIGDGKSSNTLAFQNAIFYLKSFAEKGGAQLYVPAGKWLTGSFNLASHLTLFLDKHARILGSQDYSDWETAEQFPSYGPGRRYRSLINGENLTDVLITGENGTIDGQGWIWWKIFNSGLLNYSRPHLIEFVSSEDITISNLTLLNSPSSKIHPIYCSGILIQNITAASPQESPTTGIVPDSSQFVCIENCNISTGHDAISVKSGLNEYGISNDRPSSNLHVKDLNLRSAKGSCISFGSEISGGISGILAEHLHLSVSFSGIDIKTSRTRGGYVKDLIISDVELESVFVGIQTAAKFYSDVNPTFDPKYFPIVERITFRNMDGKNITMAGNLSGISESPFSPICLWNVSFLADSSWRCSDVSGFSMDVDPKPCRELRKPFLNSSAPCFSIFHPNSQASVL